MKHTTTSSIKNTTIGIILPLGCILFFLIIENIAILHSPQNQEKDIFPHISYPNYQTGIPEFTTTIDLYSNNSIQKYVSEHTKVPQKYIPPLLKEITTPYSKNAPYEKHYLVFQAKNGYYELAKKFHETFDAYLYLTSSYRPRTAQYHLLEQGCSTLRCASIGASEHQLGLAIDISVIKNNKRSGLQGKYLKRMQQHAYKFGYINTYQKGPKIDGKKKEPRHRRYVGIKLAKYLHYKNLSFAEFYKLQQ